MRSHDIVVAWLLCLPFLATYNLLKNSSKVLIQAAWKGAADQVCRFLQDIRKPKIGRPGMRVADSAGGWPTISHSPDLLCTRQSLYSKVISQYRPTGLSRSPAVWRADVPSLLLPCCFQSSSYPGNLTGRSISS